MDALNEEFCRLLATSDWNKLRASRELQLDSGTISRYCSGETRPSLTVLKLFSRLLGEPLKIPGLEDPKALYETPPIQEPWEQQLSEAIRKVPSERRRRVVEGILATIDAHSPQQRVSSDPTTAVRKLVLDGAAKSAAEIRRNRGKGSAPK